MPLSAILDEKRPCRPLVLDSVHKNQQPVGVTRIVVHGTAGSRAEIEQSPQSASSSPLSPQSPATPSPQAAPGGATRFHAARTQRRNTSPPSPNVTATLKPPIASAGAAAAAAAGAGVSRARRTITLTSTSREAADATARGRESSSPLLAATRLRQSGASHRDASLELRSLSPMPLRRAASSGDLRATESRNARGVGGSAEDSRTSTASSADVRQHRGRSSPEEFVCNQKLVSAEQRTHQKVASKHQSEEVRNDGGSPRSLSKGSSFDTRSKRPTLDPKTAATKSARRVHFNTDIEYVPPSPRCSSRSRRRMQDALDFNEESSEKDGECEEDFIYPSMSSHTSADDVQPTHEATSTAAFAEDVLSGEHFLAVNEAVADDITITSPTSEDLQLCDRLVERNRSGGMENLRDLNAPEYPRIGDVPSYPDGKRSRFPSIGHVFGEGFFSRGRARHGDEAHAERESSTRSPFKLIRFNRWHSTSRLQSTYAA
eukprot:TRINITY_DN3154_c0_g1_i1.p1 TRINITY_DN3154_c0_g1~~TRINITY_DN3154_c0_g1_i1.p1  ORF type:complete len:488 (+),score=55.35 TRINITY_DN3154_c0_g1_i1:218-1681(+)